MGFYLLLLLAVVLAAGAFLLRGRAESGGLQIGLAVGALAALLLGLATRSSTPTLELSEYEETAGYMLGERLMDVVADEGPILVLRGPFALNSEDPTSSRFRGLRKACGDRDLVEAGPDPLGVGAPYPTFHILEGENWSNHVADWCRQYPNAAAVVSLLFEFPPIAQSWSQDLPPLYGFTAGPSQAWAASMQKGHLKALVRYKSGTGARDLPPPGASPHDVFNLRFDLVTPETFQDSLQRSR